MRGWWVYMLRCGDGSLYTGMTNGLARRVALHQGGKGARYTRGRGPLLLVYAEPCESRSEALVREHQMKSISRAEKLGLCALPLSR